MAVTAKVLVEPTALPAAETVVYTAPANVRTIIDKCTLTNTTVGVINVIIKTPAAGSPTPSDGNTIMASTAIAAGATYTCPEVTGHILAAGDAVSVLPSVIGITIRISGREIV